jgi:uncharacterized membrane protein YfcA
LSLIIAAHSRQLESVRSLCYLEGSQGLHLILAPVVFFIALIISFCAALTASISGGSASAMTLPCWLALGIPLPTAVAADKTSATLWTAVASRNYLAGKRIDWVFVSGLAVFGVLGSLAGADVTMRANPAKMKPIIGCIILLLVSVSWIHRDFGVS